MIHGQKDRGAKRWGTGFRGGCLHSESPSGLALDAGVAFPDAPDLGFVGRLGVVGEEGGGEGAGGPAELDPFFRGPSAKDAVEEAADESVATAYAVEDLDFAGFDDMPIGAGSHDGAPEVGLDADDLAEGGGKDGGLGEFFFGTVDHAFEAFDFVGEAGAAGFRALDAEAELEVFFVAHEDVGGTGDLGEDGVEFVLAVDPEGGAVVEVEGDAGVVAFGCTGEFETELSGLGREGGDEAGEVDDLDTFASEDAVEIEVFDVESAPDFTGAIVMDAGATGSGAAVGEVELVAVAPGAILFDFLAFVGHVTAGEVILDETGDGAAFDEGGEDFDGEAEVGGDTGDVGFGAGGLHREGIAAVHGLAVGGGEADAHAGRDEECGGGLGAEVQMHG